LERKEGGGRREEGRRVLASIAKFQGTRVKGKMHLKVGRLLDACLVVGQVLCPLVLPVWPEGQHIREEGRGMRIPLSKLVWKPR
jgi:hypothetical protein